MYVVLHFWMLILYAYRNGGISDRATRVDKVFVQPPWDTSEAAVEPIEEYNTTLFMQDTGVWYDYDKHNSGFSMHILYSNYILKIKTFKPSSVAMKELVPLVVTFATKISRLEWLADITCFLLSIPCLERDRVSKTDGDQWSISFPKTKTMRLKIGSWKMFFVVTLLCVFFLVAMLVFLLESCSKINRDCFEYPLKSICLEDINFPLLCSLYSSMVVKGSKD